MSCHLFMKDSLMVMICVPVDVYLLYLNKRTLVYHYLSPFIICFNSMNPLI